MILSRRETAHPVDLVAVAIRLMIICIKIVKLDADVGLKISFSARSPLSWFNPQIRVPQSCIMS